jgi:hypothetical protein
MITLKPRIFETDEGIQKKFELQIFDKMQR